MPNPGLIERVEQALDEIRPALALDGGGVEIVEITSEHVLRLRLAGACVDCPMSTATFRLGIERLIFERVPVITGVEADGVAAADCGRDATCSSAKMS